MPAERAPMRKVREVLRLRHALGVSERQIAITIGLSRSTVGEYLRRAAVIGITWPIPDGLDDAELERRLFTLPTFDEKPARPLPDWSYVHKELKRRAVTLLLLWEEYRAEHSDGYGYSRFCDLYRGWCKTISPTMRQSHGAAEKLFVDFAGDTVPVFDAATEVERRAHIFVAVLGASNTPMPRRAGRKGSPTGLGHTSTPSARSAACRRRWSATISRLASQRLARARACPTAACIPICSGFWAACRSLWSAIISRPPLPTPIATIPVSTEPTPRWRAITAPPSSRRGRDAQRTRRLLHTAPHSGDGTIAAWWASRPP